MSFASGLLAVTIFAAMLGLLWQNWPTKNYIRPKLDSYFDYIIGKKYYK